MITINLLPRERRARRMWLGTPNVTLIYAVAGLLVFGSLATVYYFQHELSTRKSTMERLQTEQAALEDDVKDAEALEAQLDVLKQRKDVIEELFYSGPEISRKLNQISDLLPVGVWLEEISSYLDKKLVTVMVKKGDRMIPKQERVETQYFTITGVTEDIVRGLSLVAETKSRLENSPFMESFKGEIDVKYQRAEPWLKNSNTEGGKRMVWRFQLSMEVNPDARKPKSNKRKAPTTLESAAPQLAQR